MIDIARIDELGSYLVDHPEEAAFLTGMSQREMASGPVLRELHYNVPQIRSMLIEANSETAIWGRGTGKSEGRIAPRSMRNMEAMPLSRGAFVGRTYLQLLERTLPPVIKGWENMGYKRGRDFWIREKPPRSLNVPDSILGPLTSEHTIYTRWGSVASLVSQDRAGAANGNTLHWIVGDEGKLLHKERWDNDLMPANRGDDHLFPNTPELHGITIASDMPTSMEAMWLLEREKLMDPKRIQLIIDLQYRIFEYQKKLVFAKGQTKVNLLRELSRRQEQLKQVRANTSYFSLASTLDNLEGYGKKNLIRAKQVVPDFVFQTAFLNKKLFLTDGAFYPDLTEDDQYDAIDYSYVDSVDWENTSFDDCRKDEDLNPTAPLHIGGDYNASINPIAIGQQWRRKDLKIINAMYVMAPQRLKDIAEEFCRYYQYHKAKKVFYYYDHTAINTSSQSDVSPADEFCNILRKNGWYVEMVYIGHTDGYQDRYELWGKALRGGDDTTPNVIFNRTNCEYLVTAMRMARVVQKNRKFEKQKKDERNDSIDQRQTTHFTDAADTLLVGYRQHSTSYSGESGTGMVIA